MPAELFAVCFDAMDPGRVARFWSGLLGWTPEEAVDGSVVLLPTDDAGFRLRFRPGGQAKQAQNHLHLDLTSTSPAGQLDTVARALDLGGRHVDVGQLPQEGHVVLGDPEGNELCVIEPGNGFLADCGFVGAVSCDGTRAVGQFWSAALGWPLVWDQDQETAVRSPRGGPKITWGGPPLMPPAGRGRVRFELVAASGADLSDEVDRLVSLGAHVVGDEEGRHAGVVLTDPDDNPFRLAAG